MKHCGFCGKTYTVPHDTYICWYRTHVLTVTNVKRQCEIEKLEYWWALHTKEESC